MCFNVTLQIGQRIDRLGGQQRADVLDDVVQRGRVARARDEEEPVRIGGQELDIVLVVMNRKGLENLLQNQFEVGGEASVAAGPVGRDASASTDIQFRAEMLSYSRSRGLFAGVSLRGASIRQDQDANERFYGSRFRTRDVVLDGKAVKPLAADAVTSWQQALAKYAAPR